jgi:hypothetical protein
LNSKLLLLAFLFFSFVDRGLSQASPTDISPFPHTARKLPVLDSIKPPFTGLISISERLNIRGAGKEMIARIGDPVKGEVNDLFKKLNAGYKTPLKVLSSEIEYSGSSDSSSFRMGRQYYSQNAYANTDWLVLDIPVSITYRNQGYEGMSGNTFNGRLSAQFDRKNYLAQLEKKLKGKFTASEFLNQIKDPLLEKKQNAEKLLLNDLHQIEQQYGSLLENPIAKLGNPEDLFLKDISALREAVLSSQYMKDIRQKQVAYTELLQKKNLGEKIDNAALEALQTSLSKEKGIELIIDKIAEHKKQWEASGLVKDIRNWGLLQKNSLEKIAKDPNTIIKLAKTKLNLNGIQKLFLKIDKLSLGQNIFSSRSLSLDHFLNNGIATEFLNKSRYAMMLFGRQPDGNALTDFSFPNTISPRNVQSRAFSLGSGGSSFIKSRFTLASFDQTISSLTSPGNIGAFFRSMVATLTRQIHIGEKGIFSADISRSVTGYRNGTGDAKAMNPIGNLFSGLDFWKNSAIIVKYADEFPKAQLSFEASASRISNGYDNPGNEYLNQGSKEYTLTMKKTFFRKKISINGRIDLREFKYNDELPDRWRNIYAFVDARIKLKKGHYLTLRYVPSKMVRIDSSRFVVSSFQKLSVDGSIAGRLGGHYYYNFLSLSSQKNAYSLSNAWVSTKLIQFTSYQTYTAGRKSIYLNTNYNRADNRSSYVYFNSSLRVEQGITYQLFKKVNASSGLSFNSIAHWYSQIGITQSISTNLSEKFNLNLYLNGSRNIKQYQPIFFDQNRIDISIQYLITNKQ